jgi:phosphoglycolate phosphatase
MDKVQVPVRWLLVLWDIDHTLIENHGVNKETYAKAFELLTGRQAEHRAETDGRTEPEIMRNMLVTHGIEPTTDYLGRLVEVLETATAANASRLRDRGHELPGARDALAALQGMLGIVQSVLSGTPGPTTTRSCRRSAFMSTSISRWADTGLMTMCDPTS